MFSFCISESRELHEHRLPSVERDEVPSELLRQGTAGKNVLPLSRSSFQEGQAQVEDHQSGQNFILWTLKKSYLALFLNIM